MITAFWIILCHLLYSAWNSSKPYANAEIRQWSSHHVRDWQKLLPAAKPYNETYWNRGSFLEHFYVVRFHYFTIAIYKVFYCCVQMPYRSVPCFASMKLFRLSHFWGWHYGIHQKQIKFSKCNKCREIWTVYMYYIQSTSCFEIGMPHP